MPGIPVGSGSVGEVSVTVDTNLYEEEGDISVSADSGDKTEVTLDLNDDDVEVRMIRLIRTSTGATPYTGWVMRIWAKPGPHTDNRDLVFESDTLNSDFLNVPVSSYPFKNRESPVQNKMYVEVEGVSGGGAGSTDVFKAIVTYKN